MEHLTNSENALVRGVFGKIANLDNLVGTDPADVVHNLFNIDYTLIYLTHCEDSIADLGVWSCLGVVREYERFQFGELLTDLSDPFKVANMLAYIWGEWLLNQSETFCNLEDEELTQEQAAAICAEIVAYVGNKTEKELFKALIAEYC